MIYNYTIASQGMEHCAPTHLTHTTQFSYYQISEMVHSVYETIDVKDRSDLNIFIQVLDLLCERYGFVSIVNECSFYVRRIDIEISGLKEGASE